MPTAITTIDPGQYQVQHKVEQRIREATNIIAGTESQTKKWIALHSLPDHFFKVGQPKRYWLTTDIDSWIANFSGV